MKTIARVGNVKFRDFGASSSHTNSIRWAAMDLKKAQHDALIGNGVQIIKLCLLTDLGIGKVVLVSSGPNYGFTHFPL